MFGKAARCPSCLGPIRIGSSGLVQTAVTAAPVRPVPENAPVNRVLADLETRPLALPLPEEPARRHCPVCGEPILATARKCRHCGEFLDGAGRAPAGEAPPEPTVLFHVLSFLIPLVGIILGALYLSKPSPACKDFGRIALLCALGQFALWSLLVAVWISVVLFLIGVGSMS